LIRRRPQTPFFTTGSKAPLSINPEPSTRAQAEGQTPGACPERSRRIRPGIVEGLIYSLGTSNRTPGEFLDLFAEHGIEVGVDIRSFPTSRYPHFTKEPLENLLESTGIRYEYLGKESGGFRKGGYLAYMETDSFRKGLERLEEVSGGGKSAFFCSEKFPWRCHRRWVAKKLIERGWRVIHIIEKGRVWVPGKGDHKII